MRYNINEEHVFISVLFKPKESRLSSLYFPWEDTLEEIRTVQLTCTEHHKVPGEWEDEPKYDGFIFQTKEGEVWHNQYPRASYGQLDDSQNYRARMKLEPGQVLEGDPTEFEDYVYGWTDVRQYLKGVLRGMRQVAGSLERESLTNHYKEVVGLIKERYDLDVKNEALIYQDKVYEDIRVISLVTN